MRCHTRRLMVSHALKPLTNGPKPHDGVPRRSAAGAVRVTDATGLTCRTPFIAQVDNTAPRIELPDSWNIGGTVRLAVHENSSGLSKMKGVIGAPELRGSAPGPGSMCGWDNMSTGVKPDRVLDDGGTVPERSLAQFRARAAVILQTCEPG